LRPSDQTALPLPAFPTAGQSLAVARSSRPRCTPKKENRPLFAAGYTTGSSSLRYPALADDSSPPPESAWDKAPVVLRATIQRMPCKASLQRAFLSEDSLKKRLGYRFSSRVALEPPPFEKVTEASHVQYASQLPRMEFHLLAQLLYVHLQKLPRLFLRAIVTVRLSHETPIAEGATRVV
jgi:hypothetical protein